MTAQHRPATAQHDRVPLPPQTGMTAPAVASGAPDDDDAALIMAIELHQLGNYLSGPGGHPGKPG